MGRGLSGQLGRFMIVGMVTVSLDFAVYQTLRLATGWASPAKAVSFVLATVVAYALNRRWTFGAAGGSTRIVGFALLYSATFMMNVGTNAVGLALLPEVRLRTVIAFLLAQAVSTTANFCAMRFLVFRTPATAATEPRESKALALH